MDSASVAGYRVIEKIGRGGMGVVFRARDCILDRDVALKYVDSTTGRDSHIEQLIREAKVASSLQHPGIVTIYGFVAEGPCIVMEYIHGCTLSQRLERGSMALDEALRLGSELVEALDYAHHSGVVHADLKPGNIMIDQAGRTKVLDFGLAHWRLASELQTLSHSGENLQRLAGTIPYMSPEMIMGRQIDYRSDIFSLGCVLFEIFSGHRPFIAENPAATLHTLLNRPPVGAEAIRQIVPPPVAELILQMLEKDPDRRWQSLSEAAVLLRCCSDDKKVRGPSLRSRVIPLLKRRHWLPLLLAVAAGVVIYLISEPGVSSRQLRVFLAQPEYYREGPGTSVDAVLWTSVINGLHLLGSVQPVLYHQSPLEGANPAQLAKMAGSDEWIYVSIQPGNPFGNVQLQRVRTGDGALMKQVNFAVPKRSPDQVALAVLSQILALYSETEPSESISYSPLSVDSYYKFFKIYKSLYEGIGDRKELFEELNSLINKTRTFPAAEILAVDLAYDLYTDTDDVAYMHHATEVLDRLRVFHPNPTLVLQREIKLAIGLGDIRRSENLVNRLKELSPADPAVLIANSRLAEYRGDLTTASSLITEVAKTAPLPMGERYRAVSLAIRNGDADTARKHIAQIQKLTPDSTIALGQAGLVELLYGDIDLAITIYKNLLLRKKHRSYLVNLGLALMLKADYREARANFSLALELQPGHLVAMLNLADAEMALGNKKSALSLYKQILNSRRESGTGDAYEKMIEAQCLAHLGKHSAAIEITLEALVKSPGDPEISYQAALVYTLAGEYKSAAVNANAAIKGGMDRRWFNLPVFSSTPGSKSFIEDLPVR